MIQTGGKPPHCHPALVCPVLSRWNGRLFWQHPECSDTDHLEAEPRHVGRVHSGSTESKSTEQVLQIHKVHSVSVSYAGAERGGLSTHKIVQGMQNLLTVPDGTAGLLCHTKHWSSCHDLIVRWTFRLERYHRQVTAQYAEKLFLLSKTCQTNSC